MMDINSVPMLFPYEPKEFWEQMRMIIREEIKNIKVTNTNLASPVGLKEKPLYKIAEICQLFSVSRTTVHDWVKTGKLRKVKIRSRVYFLANDIQRLLKEEVTTIS